MAKPDSKTLSSPLSLSSIVSSAFKDLERYLGEAEKTALAISLSLGSLPETLSLVSKLARDAEKFASASYLNLAALRQIEALLKKNVDLPGTSPILRKDTAMSKFLASEKTCRITNKRLSFYSMNETRMSEDKQVLVHMIRGIIADIMGPIGRLEFQKILDAAGFGPGFTFSSKTAEHRNLYFKVAEHHSVTADALPYVKCLLNHCPSWKSALVDNGKRFDVVRGNRVTTVPKDSATDRTIAIEPSFNVFIQKGVDIYLKRRLRRHGVNLKNQTLNHGPARVGSQRPLHAATVDLSSASDTVSVEAVRWLFPEFWVCLLDDLRSKEYTLDRGETWHKYDKFSSMGNAFTFPVETILFYATARACTVFSGGNLSVLRVYGDDIIVDPRAYLLLCEMLKFLGFTPNQSKSFAYGSFRETCGSDFYSGVDLRPVYVKEIPKDDQGVYNLYNRLIWNRVGFRMHNLCAYLYGCVKRPLIGPPTLPPGEEFLTWYAGKSVHYDHYIHAPRDCGDKFFRHDPKLGATTWRIQTLRFRPLRLDTSWWNSQLYYLAFLLGVPGKDVKCNSRFKRMVQYENISYWSDPPWRPYHFDL
jgi:hypothetical protein